MSSMNNFHALIAECELNAAVVETYRDCVRDKMLDRLCMFGSTDVFQAIATDLAQTIGVTTEKATAMLWPVSHAIYQAAVNTVRVMVDHTIAPSVAVSTAHQEAVQ